ncbi:ankyrin [Mollisia scopiformis]|uniref:Ankyrin n=1 Tax=Mollisia scopiformis TaxID=149040 RepID=A0A194XKT0_MOLSC|nr:ankyrin [Mollisia scopiformis]KUJ20736.1 ankyrin [Mollisia scopiformis]
MAGHLLGDASFKRDIQKQLNNLLQARPNQVRSKGDMTKERLRMLRECKHLRSRERFIVKSKLQEASFPSEIDGYLASFEKDPELSCQLSDPLNASAFPLLHHKQLENDPTPTPTFQPVLNDALFLRGDIDSASVASVNTLDDEVHSFKSKLDSAEAESTSHASSEYQPINPENDADGKDDASIISSTKSTRSLISLTSLKRRLQFRYSTSDLGDIKSLLGRLTISRSSEVSYPHTITTLNIQPIPARIENPVVLPGIYPQYCWEHICHNELARCDDIRLPCNRGPIYQPLGLETHRSIHPNVLFRIRTCAVREEDLESVDTFGNSVLHIAACLGAAPTYLTSMIIMGANIHSLNNADQTFLHLISLSDISAIRDFPALLGALVKRRFNFQQQDHNGQTALHSLTQYSTPWRVLSGMLQSFQFHGIDLPTSRDNRGYTVAEQLREQGFKLSWPYDEEHFLTTPDVASQPQPQKHLRVSSYPTDPQTINSKFLLSASPELLQEYEKHAELLRVIVQAGKNPSFEDSEGRNGLHCLAEVRLDLPTSKEPNDGIDPALNSPWEQYMEQLLLAGVDPNRYDKHGSTPLMSFITHWPTKDEALTTALLNRLIAAGANIHLRNRLGETALHIAVKLGHRAATKVLLSHGANVHARTSTGHGILALGTRYSNRAVHDEVLYAQISLCVCLVANAGAVSAPTILHEWASSDFRVLPDQGPREEGRRSKVDRHGVPVIG